MANIELPLASIKDYDDKEIVWKVEMQNQPEEPEQGLYLDFTRLKKFAKLAGVKHLTIESQDGGKSIFKKSIKEIDDDGIIDSSDSGLLIQAEPLSHTTVTNVKDYSDYDVTDFHWTNGIIKINMTELNDRALRASRNYHEFTEQSLWAHLLNVAIADGIYDAAKQSLISESRVSALGRKFFGATILELAAVSIADLTIFNPTEATSAMIALLGLTQFCNVMAGLAQGNTFSDFRKSFLPGKNYDRVLASLVLPRVFKVIKTP